MLCKPGQVVPTHRHITALDGVRGFAAASVFVYHYGGGSKSVILPIRILGDIVHFGWAGVSLFFVLSGFLISGILWDSYQKPNWWKRFYTRRALRIFPLYYLALFITVLVGLALGTQVRNFAPLWILALYLNNIPWLVVPWTATVGLHLEHFWSLAVEEQFYLFWPFLLALFAGKRVGAKRLILVLWILSLVYRVALIGEPNSIDWQTNFLFGRVGELLAGAYLAMAMRGDLTERERLFRLAPRVMVCTLILLVGIVIYDGTPELGPPLMTTLGLTVGSAFFASIVVMALKPGWIQSFFSSPVLRWLGKISYGIYVYHLLFRNDFIWAADKWGTHLGPNSRQLLLFAIALISTLAVASVSFYAYESFFLRLKDRVTR